ncbi:MAG: hypothetical protein B6241_12570 [Spirochaetaceae bacterium 4572_59]|nr:MAG: hypothetical protein B6241_12570 [Spirochaetaceae bacterium 4572_59]
MINKENIKQESIAGRIVLIILLLAIVAAGAFTVINMKNGSGPKDSSTGQGINNKKETVFAVTVTEALNGKIKDLLELNGGVIPDSSVDLYPDNSGKLSKLYVELGDYVRKDQLIAEVDPSRPGMSYTANPVKAEISGTITRLPFDIGATVGPQTPIATVGRLHKLQVRTYIPERFISRIRMGMKANLTFESYPGEVFPAVVTEVNPVVDEVSRTLEIKMDLVEKNSRIKAGMYAKISLITEEKDHIVRIPTDCIISRFGDSFVFVMDGENKVIKRIITTGIQINGISEIAKGLEAGEKVVYQGQTLLDDQAPVKVVRTIQPLK